MATGLNSFIACQFGSEATYGTLVPATTVMAGLERGAHELMHTNLYPRTYQGDTAVVHDRVMVGQQGDLDFQGMAAFENLPYFFNMLLAKSTPATDAGTPPAITYANNPALVNVDTPLSYSIEAGDNSVSYAYSGCLGRELRIEAAFNDLTRFTFGGFAKTRLQQTKTPALTATVLETMPANFWKLYIDASGGTIGTTQYVGCLRSFAWHVTGFTPFKCMDGTFVLTNFQQLGLEGTLETVVAADDAARTLLTTYQDVGTASALIRLEQSGSQIHTTPTTNKRVRLDGTFFLDTSSKYGANQADNVNLLTLTWRARRLSNLLVKTEVVNALTALP